MVDDVENDSDNEHIQHTIYQVCCEPDEITHISEEEYNAVINKLREADGYYDKADEVLKSLIWKDGCKKINDDAQGSQADWFRL